MQRLAMLATAAAITGLIAIYGITIAVHYVSSGPTPVHAEQVQQ
jgi:hypothetical protein